MRELVERYVGVGDSDMLDAAEGCIRDVAEITPAEVGESALEKQRRARDGGHRAGFRAVVEGNHRRAPLGGKGSPGGRERPGSWGGFKASPSRSPAGMVCSLTCILEQVSCSDD